MIKVASTHPNGSALIDPFSPSLRKVSAESMNHVASPLFFRRKISHQHAPRQSSSPRLARKISCPENSQAQHFPRVHQEEVKPFQLSRDNSVTTSRVAVDLPRLYLDVSHGIEQESSGFEGNISPLGLHVDGMDCTLQEKVKNFLRSLERNDEIYEHEKK